MGVRERDYARASPLAEDDATAAPLRTPLWRVVVLVILALCLTLPFVLPALR